MEKEKCLTFEFPVCSLIRVSITVEYLLSKLNAYLQRGSAFDLQTSIDTFSSLLNVLDKQELRSKYFQAFSHARFVLKKISNDDVCHDKLHIALSKIQSILNVLSKEHGKFAEALRMQTFFKHIMQHQHLPGSESGQLMPDYYLWLNQPHTKCLDDMESWLVHLRDIDEISKTHLAFVRESGDFQEETADNGFYQHSIDNRCQLIRIKLLAHQSVYPKVSVGQHGVSIQFFHQVDMAKPSNKLTSNITFQIASCFLN